MKDGVRKYPVCIDDITIGKVSSKNSRRIINVISVVLSEQSDFIEDLFTGVKIVENGIFTLRLHYDYYYFLPSIVYLFIVLFLSLTYSPICCIAVAPC